MQPRLDIIDRDHAEKIAIAALTFIADDEVRLARFLQRTGLRPETVRSASSGALFLLGIVDYLRANPSLEAQFLQEAGLWPDIIRQAQARLEPQSRPRESPVSRAFSLPPRRLYA